MLESVSSNPYARDNERPSEEGGRTEGTRASGMTGAIIPQKVMPMTPILGSHHCSKGPPAFASCTNRMFGCGLGSFNGDNKERWCVLCGCGSLGNMNRDWPPCRPK